MSSLEQIAQHIGGQVYGDKSYLVDSVATLMTAQPNQLSFLSNSKYARYLAETKAGVVIIEREYLDLVPNNAIVVDNSYVAYAKAAAILNPEVHGQVGIEPSAKVAESASVDSTASIAAQAVISSGVKVGKNTVIGPGCVLLDDVVVGDDCHLVANVTLCKSVKIGDRSLIHPGVVIGADGFGIANDRGRWLKVPQVGSVKIGHDVEIGANTTIDRGAIDDTVIHDGVKLDNQVQIAHNVVIGENTVIAGCVGIAGSTTIGRNCAIGGGTGINGHLTIVDGVQLTGMTMVTKSISKAGTYSSGIPAEQVNTWRRNVVLHRQLDKLTERVKELEAKLN